MIKEWSLLRVIACLSVVFLHSTSQIGFVMDPPDMKYYDFFRIILCYATPTFIVLSEIILANRYKKGLPRGFFGKRFRYVYIPFLIFAIIDSFVGKYLSPDALLVNQIFLNIFLGTYAGYFVLIIMQFYFLHYLVLRYKISMKILFPISLIVMFYHLYLINSSPSPVESDLYLKLPFTAWFGYFTIALIIGRNYEKIAEKLREYKWYTLLGIIISIFIIFINYQLGNQVVYSRRFDLFPLVISISCAVIAWGQLIPNYKIINLISNYSFPIYLIHWQVQRLIAPHITSYFNSTFNSVLVLFVLSLFVSIILIKIISLLPFGKFIVGNVKSRKYEKNLSLTMKRQPL